MARSASATVGLAMNVTGLLGMGSIRSFAIALILTTNFSV